MFKTFLELANLTMSEIIGSFKGYVQNFEQELVISDTKTYRNIGSLDAENSNIVLDNIQKQILILIETWSLLRVEKPDSNLAYLSPAGEFMDQTNHTSNIDDPQEQNTHTVLQQSTYKQSERIRAVIKEITQMKGIDTIGSSIHPNIPTNCHSIYSILTGQTLDEVHFRTKEIWIGGTNQETAKYTPPKSSEIAMRLQEVEEYIKTYTSSSSHSTIDPLSLLCAAHSYSFLLLPYDGENMKWAALWTLHLAKILAIPQHLFLPISSGIFSVRASYSEGLLKSVEMDPIHWINIWKSIVSKSIETSLRIRERTVTLYQSIESHRKSFGKAAKHLDPLLLHLCSYPHVTLSDISDLTKLTKPNAALLIKKAEAIGLLKAVTFEKRNRIYACPYILDLCKKAV